MTTDGLVCRHQQLNMPLFAWRLLGQYLAIVNFDCIDREEDRINYTHLLSCILTDFFVKHAPSIQRDFDALRLETAKGDIVGFYTASQLAAIPGATSADIPNAFIIGYDRRKVAANARTLKRAVSGTAPRSSGATTKPARRPNKVRGRGRSGGARPGVRPKKVRGAQPG